MSYRLSEAAAACSLFREDATHSRRSSGHQLPLGTGGVQCHRCEIALTQAGDRASRCAG